MKIRAYSFKDKTHPTLLAGLTGEPKRERGNVLIENNIKNEEEK